MQNLDGCVALVTGASRGIGRASAVELAKAGCELVLLGRDNDALERTAQDCAEHCENVYFYAVDLADSEALAATVSDILETTGTLNILVNNAGVRGPARRSAPFEETARTIDINLTAMMHLTHRCIPTLKSAEGPRAIINVASILGKMGAAGAAPYCASKHGVVGYTKALFEDLRGSGIKVCSICPGFVNTDMVANQGLAGERMIQPQDIAHAVRFVAEFPETGCPTDITIMPQFSPYQA